MTISAKHSFLQTDMNGNTESAYTTCQLYAENKRYMQKKRGEVYLYPVFSDRKDGS